MTSWSNSFQRTRPTGQVLWEELLVLSRFHSYLGEDEWNFCPLEPLIPQVSVIGQYDCVHSLAMKQIQLVGRM